MLRVSAVKELPALSRIGDTGALDCGGPSDDRRVADAPGADCSRVVVDRRRVAIYRDTFNRKSRGCLGGSVMLVKSRRVRQRRLRPQAGCHIQPSYLTPANGPRLFGCATEADLAWAGQLQAPNVRLSCTDQKYVCNRAMRKKNDRDGRGLAALRHRHHVQRHSARRWRTPRASQLGG